MTSNKDCHGQECHPEAAEYLDLDWMMTVYLLRISCREAPSIREKVHSVSDRWAKVKGENRGKRERGKRKVGLGNYTES